MENKREDFDVLLDKILIGIKKAVRKMVEENALRNDTVLVPDGNGGVKLVPAREVLKSLEKEDQKPN